jgi:hypothetical protein
MHHPPAPAPQAIDGLDGTRDRNGYKMVVERAKTSRW